MSSLADEIVIEPETMSGRQGDEENEDRLSDLPDCLILHILSFMHIKYVVQTCILSTRWKHLWKCIPALILQSERTYSASGTYIGFCTLENFDKFVSRILTIRDGSVALQTLDFDRYGSIEPHFLKMIATYVFSHSAHLQRLGISVNGDSSLILPCISSCRALTSLKLRIRPKGPNDSGRTLFPKSLNLPALTILDLTNFAFCTSENADCAEPFSSFNSLNSLTIRFFTVRDAKILKISSATLVSLTMKRNSSDFTKIELSAPSLSTITIDDISYQKPYGSSLSSIKQLDLDADSISFWGPSFDSIQLVARSS